MDVKQPHFQNYFCYIVYLFFEETGVSRENQRPVAGVYRDNRSIPRKLANFITYRVHLYTRGSRTDNYRIGINVCTHVNQTRGSYEPVVAHLDFNLI